MADEFDIPILFKGQQNIYTGSLKTFGFSYRIEVAIEGQLIFFEPDEDRQHFRGIIQYDQIEKSEGVDGELVKIIGGQLEKMLLNP